MTERDRLMRLSMFGSVLLALGVGVPCALALASGLVPSLGWLTSSGGMSVPLARAFALALGVVLAATGFGFWHGRVWGWWLVVAWGLWAGVEVARSVLARPLRVVEIPVPLLPALLLLVYAWLRRGDFGPPWSRSRP